MVEQTLILIKPEFTKAKVIIEIQKEIMKEGYETINWGFAKFDKETAREFYKNKKDDSFYDELTDYMSSNNVYGFVVSGDNSIEGIKELACKIREEFPERFNLKTDKMRNIVHSSSINEGFAKVVKEIELYKKSKILS